MIPENKINEASELYTNIHLRLLVPEAEITNTAEDLYNFSKNDFKAGVQFAEEYLKDLAIKFGDWINTHKEGFHPMYRKKNSKDIFWGTSYVGGRCDYTIQELFEIFIKERNS